MARPALAALAAALVGLAACGGTARPRPTPSNAGRTLVSAYFTRGDRLAVAHRLLRDGMPARLLARAGAATRLGGQCSRSRPRAQGRGRVSWSS
jgi:hypothetical protein